MFLDVFHHEFGDDVRGFCHYPFVPKHREVGARCPVAVHRDMECHITSNWSPFVYHIFHPASNRFAYDQLVIEPTPEIIDIGSRLVRVNVQGKIDLALSIDCKDGGTLLEGILDISACQLQHLHGIRT